MSTNDADPVVDERDRKKAAHHTAQSDVSRYWSRYAREYDAHQLSRLRQRGERAAWRDVWRRALPDRPIDVLDIGTGTGHAALLLAELGHRVRGIDLSEGMLQEAREKAQTAGLDVRFEVADAACPPIEPASVDAVTARYALWTMRDPRDALTRWRRLLRPGGILVVVDSLWFPDGLLQSPHADPSDQRTRDFRAAYSTWMTRMPLAEATDIDQFARVIREAGFHDVAVDPLPLIYDLDRRHGVAPNHAVQMNYRITARR